VVSSLNPRHRWHRRNNAVPVSSPEPFDFSSRSGPNDLAALTGARVALGPSWRRCSTTTRPRPPNLLQAAEDEETPYGGRCRRGASIARLSTAGLPQPGPGVPTAPKPGAARPLRLHRKIRLGRRAAACKRRSRPIPRIASAALPDLLSRRYCFAPASIHAEIASMVGWSR
jgi:hypothetical protein